MKSENLIGRPTISKVEAAPVCSGIVLTIQRLIFVTVHYESIKGKLITMINLCLMVPTRLRTKNFDCPIRVLYTASQQQYNI
jgi:hypothetical protein